MRTSFASLGSRDLLFTQLFYNPCPGCLLIAMSSTVVLRRLHVILHDLLRLREDIQSEELDGTVSAILSAAPSISLKISRREKPGRFYGCDRLTCSMSLPNMVHSTKFVSHCNEDCKMTDLTENTERTDAADIRTVNSEFTTDLGLSIL